MKFAFIVNFLCRKEDVSTSAEVDQRYAALDPRHLLKKVDENFPNEFVRIFYYESLKVSIQYPRLSVEATQEANCDGTQTDGEAVRRMKYSPL